LLVYFPKSTAAQILHEGFDWSPASSLLKDAVLLDLLTFAHQCNNANKVMILKNWEDVNEAEDKMDIPGL
jgi:hypothetical protein